LQTERACVSAGGGSCGSDRCASGRYPGRGCVCLGSRSKGPEDWLRMCNMS